MILRVWYSGAFARRGRRLFNANVAPAFVQEYCFSHRAIAFKQQEVCPIVPVKSVPYNCGSCSDVHVVKVQGVFSP